MQSTLADFLKADPDRQMELFQQSLSRIQELETQHAEVRKEFRKTSEENPHNRRVQQLCKFVLTVLKE